MLLGFQALKEDDDEKIAVEVSHGAL